MTNPQAKIAVTPKDTLFEDGTASLYRFRPAPGQTRNALSVPLLLIPSMINRWYVLDLRPGASLAEAMVQAGIDTYLIDWGIPRDEDRYLSWELVLERLHRMVRRVLRHSGAQQVAALGYCMGGTLTAIHNALHPSQIAAMISLTAPVDFSHGGLLRTLVDERWFDPFAMTAPGNLPAPQMQSGFITLRPTNQVSKWITLAERWGDAKFREGFEALDTWANDNIPFPAEAYQTYIAELYQKNALARGEHYVKGRRVDLSQIESPVMHVVASRDNICPEPAALALGKLISSQDQEVLKIEGGHVGAVVGSKASKQLYPAIARWLKARFPAPEPGDSPSAEDEDEGVEDLSSASGDASDASDAARAAKRGPKRGRGRTASAEDVASLASVEAAAAQAPEAPAPDQAQP